MMVCLTEMLFTKCKIVFIYSSWVMANLSILNILPERVAHIYIKLQNVTSKLYNTSSSITFNK